MNELYEELETPEGERKISRIAKAKDFTKNNLIKDEQRVVLRDVDGMFTFTFTPFLISVV